jgi:hypothetical protein
LVADYLGQVKGQDFVPPVAAAREQRMAAKATAGEVAEELSHLEVLVSFEEKAFALLHQQEG